MTTIKNKIRYLIGDTLATGSYIETAGVSTVFTLDEENIVSVTGVLKNGTTLSTGWSYNSTTNKVTITASFLSGDIIEIQYTYYANYSDTALMNYIEAALVHLSLNNYGDYEYDSTNEDIYPSLSPREENLIASIAAILINPDNRTYRLPDITINIPNDLPTNDKISKTIAVFKRNSHGVFDILS